MELKEFVKNVLNDINSAIKECQQGKTTQEAIISSTNIGDGNYIITPSGKLIVSKIDFEVAVSAGTETNVNGEIKGFINVISSVVGGKTSSGAVGKDENVSKVKFSIPLVYPSVYVELRKISF